MDDDEEPKAAPGSDPGEGDAVGPGAEQLQRAALEAVRAARAVLDAAESMIRDPAALDSVVRAAAGMARTATETVAGFAAAATARPEGRGADAGDQPTQGGSATDDRDDGGFESIRID